MIERVIVVTKKAYAEFIEMLKPEERILAVPPPTAWDVVSTNDADDRFSTGIQFQVITPEGVRWFWLMRGKV